MSSIVLEAAADTAPAPSGTSRLVARLWGGRDVLIAALAFSGIVAHFTIRYVTGPSWATDVPLRVALGVGGALLVPQLVWEAVHARFGSDQLAGISIITSALLGEYFAGTTIVLMLSGGETLQRFALGRATSALRALASRVPTIAHRNHGTAFDDIAVDDVRVGDELTILPHEFCPVDGEVLRGHGAMDESYLTGEPFTIPKGPGTRVLSGALNTESALIVRATRIASDSRYAQIMRVMQEAEQRRPTLRRVGDQLGAWFTPVALAIALIAWWSTGSAIRFLSVVVIATPCPLLIGIPVAIIGAVSTSARRGIIVKDPAALEQLTLCRTMIFDKTGTLTYGRPSLSEEFYAPSFTRDTLLPVVAAIERYSRHPIAGAIIEAANRYQYALPEVDWIREEPGAGLRARVGERTILITGRHHAPSQFSLPPPASTGLESIIVVNDCYAATYRFLDAARADSRMFVGHLGPTHGFTRVLLVSGDRQGEVGRLAQAVLIDHVYAEQSPEQKVEIVQRETRTAKTVFIGDGINDAPALLTATVGIAFGRNSDVTTEAARVVIIDSSLSKVDTLMHVSYRVRRVALQSALGGMLLSTLGMAFAAVGVLGPAAGAIVQEVIDLAAVLNALRTAAPISADFAE